MLCNMALITSAISAVIHPTCLLFACAPCLSHSPKRKVWRHEMRWTRSPRSWTSSSYPSAWEIRIQRVTGNVRNMNRCTVRLKNKIVVADLRRSIIFPTCLGMNCSHDVLMKENRLHNSYISQRAWHLHFTTVPFVLQVFSGWLIGQSDTVMLIDKSRNV